MTSLQVKIREISLMNERYEMLQKETSVRPSVDVINFFLLSDLSTIANSSLLTDDSIGAICKSDEFVYLLYDNKSKKPYPNTKFSGRTFGFHTQILS